MCNFFLQISPLPPLQNCVDPAIFRFKIGLDLFLNFNVFFIYYDVIYYKIKSYAVNFHLHILDP
jgi:hypothetical protein